MDVLRYGLKSGVYTVAEELMDDGEYERAAIFAELGDFWDAEEKIITCYECAGMYNKIIEMFGYTEYTVPDGVTTIPAHAFEGCTTLQKVTIPESVRFIGQQAFSYCENLALIEFNARAMDDVVLDANIFWKAGNSVANGMTPVVGKNVTRIPSFLFGTWDDRGFLSCNLTNVVFEEGSVCQSIGDYAFRNATNLVSITLPYGLKSIGEWTFSHCESLEEMHIPNSVEILGSRAFYHCENLVTVTISNKVTSIDVHTFDGCKALVRVHLPDSVTNIGPNAFLGCSAMVEVTVGAGVQAIGRYAFSGCKSMERMTFANPSNWYCILENCSWDDDPDEIAVDLSDSVKNVTYFTTNLREGYVDYNWYKKAPQTEC